jgi:hypothetical protein
MKKRIGVIGVGSAGLVSLGALCADLDNSWEIVSIYNPAINGLGVGESTNANFVEILETAMGFNYETDMEALDATKKFGTKFYEWRDNSFVSPLIQGSVALHFNTNKFKDYAFDRLPKLWPDKFSYLEGSVTDIADNGTSVSVIVDAIEHTFDYVIDCRGFPTDFENYIISNCSLVNHCIVYDQKTPSDVMYTEHHATKNGWMFGVPLSTRMSYGYLYNDTITSKEDALADLSDILKISKSKLKTREYTFTPYYAKQVLEGRILKNGNRALFFEPMSATSIFMYVRIIRAFLQMLSGEYHSLDVNQSVRNDIEDLQSVIRYYYHGGSTHDTEFWNQAKERAVDQLKGDAKFYSLTQDLNKLREAGTPWTHPGMIFGAVNWHILDKIFEFNYFNGREKFPFDTARVEHESKTLVLRNRKEIEDYYNQFKISDQEHFKKHGYVHLKNVLDELTVDLVTHYAINDCRMDFAPEGAHGEHAQVPGTHSKYADPLMESLMMQLLPVMENATGLKLYPTYSYYRLYKPGDILPPHTDRSSCEISTTVCFNFNYGDQQDSYNWPIYMEGSECVMRPGDIVVYRGIDKEHWRETFSAPEGSWHVQAFFHYVDADGPHAEWKYDRREGIGFTHPEMTKQPQAVSNQTTPQLTNSKKYISTIN